MVSLLKYHVLSFISASGFTTFMHSSANSTKSGSIIPTRTAFIPFWALSISWSSFRK